jgi:signal peptidase I
MIEVGERRRVPHPARRVGEWILTVVLAVAIVLAVKAWVVNPYRIPTSSMEPTLHCARPGDGCEARMSDRVLVNRLVYHFRDPRRGERVVFEVPDRARTACGVDGTFVKRIVGLPGETVELRLRGGRELVFVDGRRLDEPYVAPDRRGFGPERSWRIPRDRYFVLGDNRTSSCDSRRWGALPRDNLIGPIVMTYWPPPRISFG